jgi:hypothetical protein
MKRLFLTILVAIALGNHLKADSALQGIPQATAVRFCRLMVCDDEGRVTPLRNFVYRHQALSDGSLTMEQLFFLYVFGYGGWQTLRIFPHQAGESTVWYAPADALPSSMDTEHQKYICEALVRMGDEVQAGHWQNVDAFIDRMIQYQCTFAAPPSHMPVSPPHTAWMMTGLFLVFMLVPFKALRRDMGGESNEK